MAGERSALLREGQATASPSRVRRGALVAASVSALLAVGLVAAAASQAARTREASRAALLEAEPGQQARVRRVLDEILAEGVQIRREGLEEPVRGGLAGRVLLQ